MKAPFPPIEIATASEVGCVPATAGAMERRLRPRYRLGLIGLFLVCTLVSGRLLVWCWTQGPSVTDLRIFLTSVELMRIGHGQDLYHFEAQKALQYRLFPESQDAGYLSYNHLAYELLAYWPLARLPYHAALMTWGAINVGFLILIAWLMRPFTTALRAYTGIAILFWMVAFYPVLYVLGEGQDSVMSLVLIALSLWLMEREREYLAGFVLGLTLFKIHLALGIAFFVFLVPRKWRGLAGFATSSLLVTGISVGMVGRGFLSDYLRLIRQQESTTPWGFIPWFMPNFRGILEWTLIRWWDLGTILLVLFLVSLLVVGITWVMLRVRDTTSPLVLYSVAIPATLLVSYHLHVHDLSLAILPMLTLLNACVRRELSLGWARVLIISIGAFYLFGAAAGVVHYLVFHAVLFIFPLVLLWLVAIGSSVSGRPHEAAGSIP